MATTNPIVPNTILIKNMRRQACPAMSTLMMSPTTMGPRIVEAPSAGPKMLNTVGNCSWGNTVIGMLMTGGQRRTGCGSDVIHAAICAGSGLNL